MQALLDVIIPVFLVIGFGYVAVARGLFPESGVDGLMKYTQNFAIPCLLFKAMTELDLGATFNPALLGSFYLGAATGFAAGLLGGRYLFGRPWEDSVAFGFCGLFSNSVLLGLSMTERAYGAEALSAAFAIVALHAPFCYGLGMTVMEVVRNRGGAPLAMAARVARAMFRNALLIGIGLGLLVNLSGLPVPGALADALRFVAASALPAALFGVGGVLVQYRPEGDMRIVLYLTAVSLILHPAITLGMGLLTGLGRDELRAAVLVGSMAPGINTYIFANMYGVGKRVAATTVLVATACSIGTVWVWLTILP